MKKYNMVFSRKPLSRLFCILCIFILCGRSSFAAETSGVCPPWVKGDYPQKTNDTYDFMVMEGSGYSLKDARLDAELNLISSLMLSAGVTVSKKDIINSMSNDDNGKLNEKTRIKSRMELTMDGVRMAFLEVDEYWEYKNSKYDCQVLYEVAKNPDYVVYQTVEYTDRYGARGLWRSAIIPGWGQMYKGQYAKGALILGVEAAGIASSILLDNQRSSYIRKAEVNLDADAIRFYQKKANEAKNTRNLCIIGTAVVYVYNIVDAIAAKGKPRYKKPSSPYLSLETYSTSESPMGIALCYSF